MNKIDNKIVVFDFDNTLTTKSTTLPFFKYLYPNTFWLKLLPTLPLIIAYKAKIKDIDQMNLAFTHYFLKDQHKNYLINKSNIFNENFFPKILRKAAIDKYLWHKKQEHYCILATAAFDIYIDKWAINFGFDAVVSTKIEFSDGIATGKLQSLSCYGKEKLNRVNEIIGSDTIFYAYGDSNGDKELLAAAKKSFYKCF